MHGIVGFLWHIEHDFQTILKTQNPNYFLKPFFDRISHLDLPLTLITAPLQIFQQQLILGYPLHWFDQISSNRMLDVVLFLEILEKGAAVHD